MSKTLPAFEKFVTELRALWASEPDTEKRMRAAKPLLEAAIRDPEIIAHSKQWPNTVGQNLVLFEDEEFGFLINAVVRPAGYKGGVHDHADAWVLYGVIEGTESLERFERTDDGKTPGHAVVRLTHATEGKPGTVDLVPPNNIHAEQGGPTRSTAMILRNQRLVGRVLQGSYDRQANTVIQRSGPAQIPYPLTVEEGARNTPS